MSLPGRHISPAMWSAVLVVTAVTILIFLKQRKKRRQTATDTKTRAMDAASSTVSKPHTYWTYTVIKDLVHKSDIPLPAMFVDMDKFDNNIRTLVAMVNGTGKTLRVATKSVRCPFLIKRIAEVGGSVIRGFMCYSLPEIALLANEGLGDFYMAYPTMQNTDIKTTLDLMSKGHKVTLTVDCTDHVKCLDKVCEELRQKYRYKNTRICVSIDLDMSYKLFGGLIHLGAHRSRVDSIQKFAEITDAIKTSKHVNLVGVMGYEAHVAGLPDNNPFSPLPNALIRLFKKHFFYHRTLKLRKQVADYCKSNEITLDFFNGGGSGNLRDAANDPSITEVSAGSGFLQAQLFDYYVDNKCMPALYFALQATRVSEDCITCQGGGFIASGTCSQDKCPQPFSNPKYLQPYNDEGYGEVQTPLRVTGRNNDVIGTISVSDPVLFRPAKSGEIGEHFNEYILLRDRKMVDKVHTYRGLGFAFH